jgi:predicted transposase YdaD
MFTLGDLRQTKVYQEAKQEGRQEGRQEGEQRGKIMALREILYRQIARKFGGVPDSTSTKLEQLSLEQLGVVAEAIIDVSSLEELENLLT